MKLWGLTLDEVQDVVADTSAQLYDGNVIVYNERMAGNAVQFVLRVRHSRYAGARLATSGRHARGASWHAHRDIMLALFERGATRIQTAMADYRGLDDFKVKFQETGQRNVGSIMQPVRMMELSVFDRQS